MAQYRALYQESIYDIAVKLYPDVVLGISDLLLKNEIDINGDLTGQIIEYSPNLVRKKPVFEVTEKPKFYTFLSRNGQSHWDLAIQLYGDISQIGEILKTNTDINGDIPFNSEFLIQVPEDPQAVFFLDKIVTTK